MRELSNYVITPPPIIRRVIIRAINSNTSFDTSIWRKDFEDYVEYLKSIGIMKSYFYRKFHIYPSTISESNISDRKQWAYEYMDQLLIDKENNTNTDVIVLDTKSNINDTVHYYSWTYDELDRLKVITLFKGYKANVEYSITPVVEYKK